jgi:hypothetical protein
VEGQEMENEWNNGWAFLSPAVSAKDYPDIEMGVDFLVINR